MVRGIQSNARDHFGRRITKYQTKKKRCWKSLKMPFPATKLGTF
jgi:hypothetical protein